MKLIKVLASLAMVTFLNYSFADGHDVNLKSKKIGLLQLNWSPEALFMTSANSGSNKLSGTITIDNTKGNIDACYEKFMIKSTGPILNNVTCQVKFDNGTTMQMDYSMVLSPSETLFIFHSKLIFNILTSSFLRCMLSSCHFFIISPAFISAVDGVIPQKDIFLFHLLPK